MLGEDEFGFVRIRLVVVQSRAVSYEHGVRVLAYRVRIPEVEKQRSSAVYAHPTPFHFRCHDDGDVDLVGE